VKLTIRAVIHRKAVRREAERCGWISQDLSTHLKKMFQKGNAVEEPFLVPQTFYWTVLTTTIFS